MKLSVITVTYNRPQLLETQALESILNQSDKDLEWVIVNDGSNPKVRQLINSLNTEIPIVYLEMEHDGFGLCKGRNLALEHASGDFVCYLDDDNSFYPDFISEVKRYFAHNPNLKYFMPIQSRRRDISEDGKIVKIGKPFLSPSTNSSLRDFINPTNTLFDSNGFVHQRVDAPIWNENLIIYCDYEFFLRCADKWGDRHFGILPETLVEYIQTNEGEVGKSGYRIWAKELNYIFQRKEQYPILSKYEAERWFPEIMLRYQKFAKVQKEPTAFTLK